MIQDDITELLKSTGGGKYQLTRYIAERARQLQNGALPLAEASSTNSISIAIQEIIEGKVSFSFTQSRKTKK